MSHLSNPFSHFACLLIFLVSGEVQSETAIGNAAGVQILQGKMVQWGAFAEAPCAPANVFSIGRNGSHENCTELVSVGMPLLEGLTKTTDRSSRPRSSQPKGKEGYTACCWKDGWKVGPLKRSFLVSGPTTVIANGGQHGSNSLGKCLWVSVWDEPRQLTSCQGCGSIWGRAASRIGPLSFAPLCYHPVQTLNCRCSCGCPKLWDKDIRNYCPIFGTVLCLLCSSADGHTK